MYSINRYVMFSDKEDQILGGYMETVKTDIKTVVRACYYIKKCYSNSKKHAKDLRKEFNGQKFKFDKMVELFEVVDETDIPVTDYYWRREIWRS